MGCSCSFTKAAKQASSVEEVAAADGPAGQAQDSSQPTPAVVAVPSAEGAGQGQAVGQAKFATNSGQLLDLLPTRGGDGSPADVWMQASFAVQLRKLVREHPFLEPRCSVQLHPLQNLVDRCSKSSDARNFGQAQKHLHRILAGLKVETELAAEAFRLFDLDQSGHLDDLEFRHMCAYLGWGDEKIEVMDLDGDGKVTSQDMQMFVGYMGGVQKFFEQRLLRISTSRKDASHYSGIALGAHVRAHFYVKGQKSSMWKEAEVVGVDVEMNRFGGSGPATVGVLLEFAFGPGERWRARQVVPMHWVIGTVEDDTVLSMMKTIGMAEGRQSLWALLMPDSELQAMRRLTASQLDALTKVRQNATEKHEHAFPGVLERFKRLNYSEHELQAVLGWVQDLAPLVVHVPLDETGRFLETDEYFRNQFEIIILLNRRGKGNDEHARFGWESRLYGTAYDKAEPFERVKYGAMNIMNDYKGVHSVSAFGYGDSYVVLKDVRLRTSFTFGDSCCCSLSDMGTLDKYAHVLNCFGDREIHAIVAVATAAIAPESEGRRQDVGAAQLELLRGTSQDPTSDWITVGFPGLAQRSGRHYFEVILYEGCRAPQVGLLSTAFERRPYVTSGEGVGDDEHGWAVDGQNCARWHRGQAEAWGTAWPCKPVKDVPKAGQPGGSPNERALCEHVVVGIAVDLDRRTLRFSTNGAWDEDPAFTAALIPKDAALYPAVSLQGCAAFSMGPKFRHGPPPQSEGTFRQWPGTFGGIVRVDCPELGNSRLLSGFKEYQVHGEVSLKRNVQRLVAHPKYREKQKTERSYNRLIQGDWPFSGRYRRTGALHKRTMYKSSSGAVIHWDPAADLWKISESEDLTHFSAWAPPVADNPWEPPRGGWKVPDEIRGVMAMGPFRDALAESGLGSDDVQRIVEALAVKGSKASSGPRQVFRVKGTTSLEDELKRLQNAPQADKLWKAAIEKMQRQLLTEAMVPQAAEVVETNHPHGSPENWQREVKIPGATGLLVQFASRTSTCGGRADFGIKAGGLDREAAGRGARVDVPVPGGVMQGTVVERTGEGKVWRVRLDRREPAEPEATASKEQESDSCFAVGDSVEAEYVNGIWYKATIAEWHEEVDWYEAKRVPVLIRITWADSEVKDRDKTIDQIRRPRKARTGPAVLEDLPRYGLVPNRGAESFACCSEEPKVITIAYGPDKTGGTAASEKAENATNVGTEIASFSLDVAYPFTPVSIAKFSGPGPAQEQGITTGWYLDVVATVMQARDKKVFALLLDGLGGIAPFADGEPAAAQLTRDLNRLLDAAFKDPVELLRRLNDGLLALSGVTLYFTNNPSPQKLRLLPEAHVAYHEGQRVSSEVRLFTSEQGQVRVDSFLKRGPAQDAGVRTDWVLDISKTQIHNPSKTSELTEEALRENPNLLLSLKSVILVFRQPNTQKVQVFTGHGSANSETWCCRELPGSSAGFTFASFGSSDGDLASRWGVWALVLPQGAPRLSMQDLDSLSNKWVESTAMAVGMMGPVEIESDEWDEARLRALCARHGWEFEWMTEDGERRRRANERQAFLTEPGDLSGARKMAEAVTQQLAAKEAEDAARAAAQQTAAGGAQETAGLFLAVGSGEAEQAEPQAAKADKPG